MRVMDLLESDRALSFSAFALFLLLGAGALLPHQDPASLPAHDAHEGLLIAADPYLEAARYKARFGKKNPYGAGILAVDVYFRNDNDKAIRLNLDAIRLLLSPPGGERQRFGALPAEDVVDRILNKGGPNPNTSRRPLPIPGRGPKTPHGKEWREVEEALRATAFEMDILPPRSSVHGVFFFDVDSHYDWLGYMRLYIPELKFVDTKQPLLFFEVDLAPAQPR